MRSVLYRHDTRMFQYGEHIEDMEKQMKRGYSKSLYIIDSTKRRNYSICDKEAFLRTYQSRHVRIQNRELFFRCIA